MKIQDSGMPDEQYWESLFDIRNVLAWLDLEKLAGPIVEIGCGYGTFTVPVAMSTKEIIYAFDIDPEMIRKAQENARNSHLTNVRFELRDVFDQGTGLSSTLAGMVLLFNILHFPERRILLQEASRILAPSGRVAIIHWRKDIPTPRGPQLELRPDEAMILESIAGLSLRPHGTCRVLEPYHWGMQLAAFPEGTP